MRKHSVCAPRKRSQQAGGRPGLGLFAESLHTYEYHFLCTGLFSPGVFERTSYSSCQKKNRRTGVRGDNTEAHKEHHRQRHG